MSDASASPLRAQPATVGSLVEYQPDAIVSRILVKQPAGSVTLFAFDASQSLGEHTVPHDALVHVLDGEAEITVSGIPHRLPAGEAILMPAHEPHAVRAVTRFKMLLTMLKT
ncbi:MAG: cupin domain-containing protein [Gemmatimonadota bacterium]|nr:cupin domain-containing protein [Gemmatimonadota bacterium]